MSSRSLTNREVAKVRELLSLLVSLGGEDEPEEQRPSMKRMLALHQAIQNQMLLAYRTFLYELAEEQGITGQDFNSAAELNHVLQGKKGETVLPDLLEAEQDSWLALLLHCFSPSLSIVGQQARNASSQKNIINLKQLDEIEQLSLGPITHPGTIEDVTAWFESLIELISRVRSLNQEW